MGYCFHHWLCMTSKGTVWIFPEDESVVCFQMTVRHRESAYFRSRPVIMLPWKEIVRLLKKNSLGKKKRLLASHKTTSSRTFPPWLVGVLPGNRSPFPGCWLISRQSAVGSGKYNLGGDLEELVVSMGVCVKTEPQGGIWLLFPAAATLQCVIPLDPATAALSPWVRWSPRFLLSFLLKGWTDSLVGIQGVGEKVWDSPTWPSKHGGERQGKLINWQSLILFHFHISSKCFRKQKQ